MLAELITTLLEPGTGYKAVPIVNGAVVALLVVLGASAATWAPREVTVHLAVMAGLAVGLLLSVNWFARELRSSAKKAE